MYAVIDTETTGLSFAKDRIIELAIVGLDLDGNKEWEWCSLINPERDTGHGLVVRIHQIYARDVEGAPTFADFAGHISDLLSGRVVIAHNASFDLGMLSAEFARLGESLPPVARICTSELARDCGFRPWKLENCCAVLGIEPEGKHHALADARATWHLAQHLFDFSHEETRSDLQMRVKALDQSLTIPVVTREAIMRPIVPCQNLKPQSIKNNEGIGIAKANAVRAVPEIETFVISREKPESKYLAAVEWVLEDREVTPEQQFELDELRLELELSDDQVREVHMTFMRGLTGSMWEDSEISKHEQFDLDIVGKALRLTAEDIKYALEHPIELGLINESYKLKTGSKVVFTGEMSLPRAIWTARAKEAGIRVTGAVSGKTDCLVVPFGETGSSKSQKARALGVRVVTEQRFQRMLAQMEK